MDKNNRFTHHMTAMREHYKAGASHTYALPLDMIQPTLNSAEPETEELSGEILAEIIAALKYCEKVALEFLDAEKKSALKIVRMQGGAAEGPELADTDSFVAQMNVLKEQARQRSGTAIDQMYDKLIATGTQHPPAQPTILSNTQSIMAQQGSLLLQLGAFYGTLGPAGLLVEPAVAVANWFGDAAKSVGDFFSNLF